MTVQELIDELQKLPDKTLDVCVYDWGYYTNVAITEEVENNHGKHLILIDRRE